MLTEIACILSEPESHQIFFITCFIVLVTNVLKYVSGFVVHVSF